ncbi:MAG: hypothetical protein NWF05_05355 [Candidatus Bathyarchaeota archaeon]|nr:hypothetical protein [Candidatus Bathyarchaeota archaeon]
MTNRELLILIEECTETKEAHNIFKRRGWDSVNDRSIPLPGKRQTRKTTHNTSLISMDITEWEYGGGKE